MGCFCLLLLGTTGGVTCTLTDGNAANVVGQPTADYPNSIDALCEKNYVTSTDDISYTTACQNTGQFDPKTSCGARNYASTFQKLHDSTRGPVVIGTVLQTASTTRANCEQIALSQQVNVFTFASSDNECKVYNLGLTEDLQHTAIISIAGSSGAYDVYARGDVNVAYGKNVIVAGGTQADADKIVDGLYHCGTFYLVTAPLPWIKVDLGHWYRVARVHLTMGSIVGAATVTIKAIDDPSYNVNDGAAVTGHQTCVNSVSLTLAPHTKIFFCSSSGNDYMTARVIAAYIVASVQAPICELAVYTEQGNTNLALGKTFNNDANGELSMLVDGTQSNLPEFASCNSIAPPGTGQKPSVIINLGTTQNIFKVAITNSNDSPQGTFSVFFYAAAINGEKSTCFVSLDIPAGTTGFQYCDWPLHNMLHIVVEGDAADNDMKLCEIEVYAWVEHDLGLEKWQADCPLMSPGVSIASASNLEGCADSCHDSANCRGIMYRSNTCYQIAGGDSFCDYTKDDASVTIGYKIKKCDATTYTNAVPFAKQYYGDEGTVTCNVGYSLDENDHTKNTKQAYCTIAGTPNYFSDTTDCTAVKCTFDGAQPANINEANIVGQIRYYSQTIDLSCSDGYVQRPDPPADYSASYPSTYNITCTADGTFNIPADTCQVKPCGMPKPENTTASDPVTGLLTSQPYIISCVPGHHVMNDEDSESYSTNCNEAGWTANIACIPKLCRISVPGNVSYPPGEVTAHFPAVVRLTCTLGYVVQSTGSQLFYDTTCGTNGQFSHNLPCEKRRCSIAKPAFITHASAMMEGVFEDEHEITCEVGHVLSNQLTDGAGTGNSYSTRCGSDGLWSDTTNCTKIRCPSLLPDNVKQPDFTGFFEDERIAECIEGYRILASNDEDRYHARCLETGYWNATDPCKKVHCRMPRPNNTNHENETVEAHYQDTVSITCENGYMLVRSGGTPADNTYTAMCQATGIFSQDIACEKRRCSIAKPAFITHASAMMEGVFEDEHEITCEVGHVLSNQPTDGAGTGNSYSTRCGSDGLWSDTTNCTKIRCPSLLPDNVKQPDFTGFFEDERIAECIEGYRILASNDEDRYHACCLETGYWNATDPCKKVHCRMPRPNNTNHENETVEADYQDTVSITCENGHVLVGSGGTPTDNTYIAICEATGIFSLQTACERLSCSSTLPPGNTTVNGTSNMASMLSKFDDITTITCIEGYVISGTSRDTTYPTVCQADAQYNDTLPCQKIRCDIPTPENIMESDANGVYLDEITLHCLSGFRILTDSSVTEYVTNCTASGNWSILEACRRVICPPLFPQNTQQEVFGEYEDEFMINCTVGYITTMDGSDYITADNYTNPEVIRNYTVKCEADGQWNRDPSCRRTFCKAPAFDNTTQQDDPGTDFVGEYEETKPVNCKTGYWTTHGHLRNYVTRCGPWGVWLTNNCVKVECVGLEIENADVSPSKPISVYEDSVQVTCGDNFETEDQEQDYYSQCADSGNWTHVKKCLLKKCDPITLLNTNATDHIQAASSTVLVSCITGHENRDFQPSFQVTCNANREWRNLHNCSRVRCKKLNVANTNTWDVDMQYGDTVEVVTSPGYENQFGNNAMNCSCGADKEWTPKPIITPVRCRTLAPDLTLTSELDSFYPLSTLVKCRVGCSLPGSTVTNYVSQCNASAIWSDLIPCEQIWCPEYNAEGWTEGLPESVWGTDVVRACTTGHEASGEKLQVSCYCGNGGHWSIHKCFKIKCPAFIAANVAQSGLTGTYEDTLYIQCPEGHQTVAGLTKYNTTCRANKAWSEMLGCWPRNCSEYSIPNTTVQSMVGSFGQVKNGSCIAGYTITSTVSSFELRCNASGQWEHPPTACNPVSCDPFVVKNSEGVPDSKVSGNFGDSVTVRCRPGYLLPDNLEQVTTFCNGSGKWTWKDGCHPVTCPYLTFDRSVEPTAPLVNFTYGTIYECRCKSGFSDMTEVGSNGTQCLSNGQWTPTPICLPLCPTLRGINYGTLNTPTEPKVNAQAIYECTLGFHLDITDVRRCVYFPVLRISVWSGTTPTCIVTPIPGFWHPWSVWTRCTSTCNHGTHQRERRCEPPLYGGAPCVGEEFQSEVCSEVPCPVDSSIEEWMPWTPCKATCGLAYQRRTRKCNPALHGGKPCDEHKDENNNKIKLELIRNCDIPECPLPKYEAVTQMELQGQYKEADNRPMIRIASISIGVLFMGLVCGLAIVMDVTGFFMKRHDMLQRTARNRAKRRIIRIPASE